MLFEKTFQRVPPPNGQKPPRCVRESRSWSGTSGCAPPASTTCCLTFSTVEHVHKDNQQNSNEGQGILSCLKCKNVFDSHDNFNLHVCVKQEEEDTFGFCTHENCNEVFRDEDALQKHILQKHDLVASYETLNDNQDVINEETLDKSL